MGDDDGEGMTGVEGGGGRGGRIQTLDSKTKERAAKQRMGLIVHDG